MKVYVLNLKEDTERLKTISNALAELAIKWERIEAVRGSLINRQKHPEIFCGTEFVVKYNLFSRAYYRGSLTDGELGCALSHLKVYHQIAMSDEDGAIIMEDDFVPKENVISFVKKALDLKPNADIIYCHGAIKAGLRKAFWLLPQKIPGTDKVLQRQGIPGFNWFFNRRRRHMSTVCYWISKRAAIQLLELGYPVKFESDVLTGLIAYNHFKFYVIYPGLGKTSDFGSSIKTHGGCKFY